MRHRRCHVLEYLQPLAADVRIEVGKSGQVAAGMGNVRDEALTNRVRYSGEYDRNSCRSLMQRNQCRRSKCQQNIGRRSHQLLGITTEDVGIGSAPPISQFKIATLVPSRCTKSRLECASEALGFRIGLGNCHQCTHARRALLCPRDERPSNRTAEKRNELAPPHSITSSARASTDGGIVRPSALAVVRLMTSSNLVGACTGSSAGFSPLSI